MNNSFVSMIWISHSHICFNKGIFSCYSSLFMWAHIYPTDEYILLQWQEFRDWLILCQQRHRDRVMNCMLHKFCSLYYFLQKWQTTMQDYRMHKAVNQFARRHVSKTRRYSAPYKKEVSIQQRNFGMEIPICREDFPIFYYCFIKKISDV
jgi:hypothetical protein